MIKKLRGCKCSGCYKSITVYVRTNKAAKKAFEKKYGGKISYNDFCNRFFHYYWKPNCVENIDYGKWEECGIVKISTKPCFEGV